MWSLFVGAFIDTNSSAMYGTWSSSTFLQVIQRSSQS
jgi:hypothetical protein